MAYRNGAVGMWRIKRNYGMIDGVDVGSFNITSGSASEKEAEQIEDVFDKLAQMGKHGAIILKQVALKQRTPLSVLNSWNNQDIKNLPAILGDEPLEQAWMKFIDGAVRKDGTPISQRTKHDYRLYFNILKSLKENSTVKDLPSLVQMYRDVAVTLGHFQQFRKVKMACLSFARNTEADKQFSELWKEINKVNGVPVQRGKIDIALRVYECRALIDQLPENYQHIAWTMALTGMGPKDYAGTWKVMSDRVKIEGTKNVNRIREVPLLSDGFVPEPFTYYYPGTGYIRNEVLETKKHPVIDYYDLNKSIQKVSHKKYNVNVFRHCYRLWLREAGVDEWRADRYFGHVVKDVKRGYAASEWQAFMRDDTEKLVAYIEREWEPPKKQSKPVKRLKV